MKITNKTCSRDSVFRTITSLLLQGCLPALLALASSGVMAKGPGLSPQTYNRLTSINQQIEQERYVQAVTALRELLPLVEARRYDKAVVMQTLGHVQASRGRYRDAMNAYQDSLSLDALPEPAQQQMRYNLAQIYLMNELPQKAVKVLQAWFDGEDEPGADAYALLGNAYGLIKQYRKAVPAFQKAIKLSSRPREPWYQSLLAMHYELGSYTECANLLERMIRLFPNDPEYWKQLASVYMQLNKHPRALTVLELAYLRGMVRKEQELVRLAQLYLYQEMPIKAARILAAEMDSGRVRRNGANQQLLASAWAESRERVRAIEAYQLAAKLADKPEIGEHLAWLYLEDGRWRDAAGVLESSLSSGEVKDTGNTWLMLGIARYESGLHAEARTAFEQAATFESTREPADQWLAHLASVDQES